MARGIRVKAIVDGTLKKKLYIFYIYIKLLAHFSKKKIVSIEKICQALPILSLNSYK